MSTTTPFAPVAKLSYPADVVRRAIDESGLGPAIFFANVNFDFKNFPFKGPGEAKKLCELDPKEKYNFFQADTKRIARMQKAALDFIANDAVIRLGIASAFKEVSYVLHYFPYTPAGIIARKILFPEVRQKARIFLLKEKNIPFIEFARTGICSFQLATPSFLKRALVLKEQADAEEEDLYVYPVEDIRSLPPVVLRKVLTAQFPRILDEIGKGDSFITSTDCIFLYLTPNQLKQLFKVQDEWRLISLKEHTRKKQLEYVKCISEANKEKTFISIEEALENFHRAYKDHSKPRVVSVIGYEEDGAVLEKLKAHFAKMTGFSEVYTFLDDCERAALNSMLRIQKNRLKELAVTPKEWGQILNIRHSLEERVEILENIFKLVTAK